MFKFTNGIHARKVYEAFRAGDSLADDALVAGAAYWRDLSDKLLPMGDTFRLASQEANRVAMALESFVSERKLTALQEKT